MSKSVFELACWLAYFLLCLGIMMTGPHSLLFISPMFIVCIFVSFGGIRYTSNLLYPKDDDNGDAGETSA